MFSNFVLQKYKNKIFNTERLEYKFKSFEFVTLPSVINQTNKNYLWYIYYSEYLPPNFRERLLNITKKYNQIICKPIKSFKYFNKIILKNNKYCTIRLDDDDGLSKNFVQSLNKYKHLDKVIISHPYGLNFTIKDNKIIYGKQKTAKNIALGLCAIGMNIYHCGNHTKVHKNYRVIYDSTQNMYLLNCSKFTDSGRKFT